MYSLYGRPRYFKFKQKYQQIRPAFPDYLSVSYEYGARNLDKYFHFYGIAGPKVQDEGNIYKNVNNCMPQLFISCFVAKKIAVSVW